MALREDNLGLGAKRNQGDECTGLDDFKDLLGRLNGKSEAVIEGERRVREEGKLNRYVERKFGRMRFVSGGFLGRQEVLLEEESVPPSRDEVEAEMAALQEEPEEESATEKRKREKKEKKSKKRKAQADNADDEAEEKLRKREKKKRKKEREGKDASDIPPPLAEETLPEPRPKKSKKDRRKEDQAVEDPVVAVVKTLSRTDILKDSGESTPSSETENAAMSGRHLARKRFIAQKRRALMDEQALKQVSDLANSRRPFHERLTATDIHDQDIARLRYPVATSRLRVFQFSKT